MNPTRLLVVDDSRTIRRALEFILAPRGFDLAFAVDGREALEQATEFQPDLVLLDYVLPDMRGPDVCAALAAMPGTAQTPVILVSAKGASIRQAYQDARNVVSYVTKPFKPEVVLSVVENALARERPGPMETTPQAALDDAGITTAAAHGPGGRPPTLDGIFSTLLEQLEDAAATEAAPCNQDSNRWARVNVPLRRASETLQGIGQDDPRGDVPPVHLGRDGALIDVAAALLESHRLLCTAALALADTLPSGPGEAPTALVAVARDDVRSESLAPVAGETGTFWIDRDFHLLPWIVRLVRPQLLVCLAGSDRALEAAAAAVPCDGLRPIVHGAPAAPLDEAWKSFERIEDLDEIGAVLRAPTTSTDESTLDEWEVVAL